MIRAVEDLKKKPNEEWEKELSDQQYYVCRLGGTEHPFSGKYEDFYEDGKYACAACGTDLFASDTKFHSGSGWPSFFDPIDQEKLEFLDDDKLGVTRTEVRCSTCGSHLGHVFDDGPEPTGKRFCINSVALNFTPKNEPTS